MTDNNRLIAQMDFIKEIDKLKSIYRQTLLIDGSRNENDAEHSWHLSVMAMLLSEYANGDVNILKVLKMLIIHDLVEIYAGDTFCYDKDANKDKENVNSRQINYLIDYRKNNLGVFELWKI